MLCNCMLCPLTACLKGNRCLYIFYNIMLSIINMRSIILVSYSMQFWHRRIQNWNLKGLKKAFLRPFGRNQQQIPLLKNKMPDWLFHVTKVGSDLDLLLTRNRFLTQPKYVYSLMLQFMSKNMCGWVEFNIIIGSRRCMREIQEVAFLWCGAQATCPFKFKEKGRLLPSIKSLCQRGLCQREHGFVKDEAALSERTRFCLRRGSSVRTGHGFVKDEAALLERTRGFVKYEAVLSERTRFCQRQGSSVRKDTVLSKTRQLCQRGQGFVNDEAALSERTRFCQWRGGSVREDKVLSKTRRLCQRGQGFVNDEAALSERTRFCQRRGGSVRKDTVLSKTRQLCQRGHGFVKDEAALSERTRFCQRRVSSVRENTVLSKTRQLCQREHGFVKDEAALSERTRFCQRRGSSVRLRENTVLSKTRQLCQRGHSLAKTNQICQRGHGFDEEDVALSVWIRLCRKDTALSENTALSRWTWFCLSKRTCSSVGEDTTLSERMCLHVSSWMRFFRRWHGFVREDTTLSKSMRLCWFWRGCDFVREAVHGSFNVNTYTL